MGEDGSECAPATRAELHGLHVIGVSYRYRYRNPYRYRALEL